MQLRKLQSCNILTRVLFLGTDPFGTLSSVSLVVGTLTLALRRHTDRSALLHLAELAWITAHRPHHAAAPAHQGERRARDCQGRHALRGRGTRCVCVCMQHKVCATLTIVCSVDGTDFGAVALTITVLLIAIAHSNFGSLDFSGCRVKDQSAAGFERYSASM